MSKNHYDVIVTGVGSMGAAACWYLAKKKLSVLGLEQFDIPHDQGSHGGQSRIIRKAYYEHSNYVALLERAYQNWRELEEATGAKVYYKTGLLYFGDKASVLIRGTRETAERFNIPLDVMNAEEGFSRFGTTRFEVHHQVLFEPDAGFITPEKAIALYAADAIECGADIKAREKVTGWKCENSHITVNTNKSTYTTDRLVIAAGAWTSKVVQQLPAQLKVSRQIIAWLKPSSWSTFTLGKFPCWFMNDDDGNLFYGFPGLPPKDFGGPIGLKVAHHKMGMLSDPDHVDRNIKPGEEDLLRGVLDKYFPGAAGDILAMKTCLYTNSDDADFIIDHIPDTNRRVAVAAGFSGHGFKFSSIVGEILSDLVTTGATQHPIDFLKLDRFRR